MFLLKISCSFLFGLIITPVSVKAEKDTISYNLDPLNRRFFPALIEPKEKDTSSFYVWPNCTSTTTGTETERPSVGCVTIPSSVNLQKSPSWAGTLYSGKPPICENKRCDLQVPMSNNALQFNVTSSPSILDGSNFQLKPARKPHPAFFGGLSTTIIMAADLNSDGLPDIISGNYGEPNELLLNQGDGTYEEATGVLPGNNYSNTTSIVIGDLNADGALDLVIGNYGEPNQLLFNQGDGTFQELETGSISINTISLSKTTAMALADVNLDGFLDLIVGNYREANQLFLNTGDGSFYQSSSVVDVAFSQADSLTKAITVADFNGNGLVDIAIGNELQPNELFLNQGNGSFEKVLLVAGSHLDDSFNTSAILAADINGDQLIDLIIGNYNTEESNQLLLNQGDGTFQEAEGVFLSDHSTTPLFVNTLSLAVADMDGDGRLDVLVSTGDNQPNQLLLNQGAENFQAVAVGATIPGFTSSIDGAPGIGDEYYYYPSTRSITVADLDADGRVDILIGNYGDSNQVFLNKERFAYLEVSDIFGDLNRAVATWSMAVEDLDGDGLPDVVVANDGLRNQVMLNQGDGTFLEVISDVSTNGKTLAVATGDLNGDGMPDIVIGNYYSEERNKMFFNIGSGRFEESDQVIPGIATRVIALADFNADGHLDILVGNSDDEANHLLLNQGDGTFVEAISAIPGEYHTRSIGVADLNNDSFVDIVIGNFYFPNQLLLNNGDGTFEEKPGAIPVDSYETTSIVLADLNSDGLIDIVMANGSYLTYGAIQNQLLLNRGNGMFQEMDGALPQNYTYSVVPADVDGDGHVDLYVSSIAEPHQLLINQGDGTFEIAKIVASDQSATTSVAVGDFNRDGRIDIIIGKGVGINQLLLFSTCPYGGAPLHGSSWCFPCPNFMGRRPQQEMSYYNYNLEFSLCQECAPDYMQDESTKHCSTQPCPLQARKLGTNICQDCQDGYYYNSTIVRSEEKPFSFLSERCAPCERGTFFSLEAHGKAIDQCTPCLPGSYASKPGSIKCVDCDPGTFQASLGQSSCTPCQERTFAKGRGANKCDLCPARLSSLNGSATCSYCSEGYLMSSTFRGGLLEVSSPGLNQESSSSSSLFTYFSQDTPPHHLEDFSYFSNSSNYTFYTNFNGDEFIFEIDRYEEGCLACPQDAKCTFNSTLETLGVPPNYWRDSRHTTTLYLCGGNDRCTGNLEDTSSNNYCKVGHYGPLCKVCDDDDHYFSETRKECLKCPSSSLIGLKALAILLGGILIIVGLRISWNKAKNLKNGGLQTKIKILVSFYQVAATFQGVYGMRFDEEFADTMDFLSQLTFGIFDLIPIPADCMGSRKEQLLFVLLSPLGFLLLVGSIMTLIRTLSSRRTRQISDAHSNVLSSFLSKQGDFKIRYINIIIITFYLVLPGVSNNVFSIIRCEHFRSSDDEIENQYSSYLIDDLSIQCDRSEPEYFFLLVIFWVSVVLWLCLVLILWSLLLTRIWNPVRNNKITPLANACRFLWIDYEPSLMFWDIFDMIRKIFLTGIIACIDMKSSTEIFRLIIAGIVSLIYVVFLAMSRPYKRTDDQYLAVISNVMLICCFLMGIVLNLCDDGICETVIGLGSYTASVVVVLLTLGTLVLTFVAGIALLYFTITHPTVRLVSSGEKPNLILDDTTSSCEYHAFFSHVWETGQAKSHAIVRKIQLVMPDIKIWLDVDNIRDEGGDGGNLEVAIEKSVVLLLFYSKGYFASENCKREIYTALQLGKPVIVIYEGNESQLENMREECSKYMDEENLLLNIFEQGENHFISWINEDIFAAKALNNICSMLFSYLPYYQRHPCELEEGLYVPGEIGEVKFNSHVNVLVCRANEGSLEVVHKAKQLLGRRNARFLSISEPISDVEELESLLPAGKREEIDLSLKDSSCAKKQIIILYLNRSMFETDEEELTILLKRVININLDIILLHELDLNQGGCKFDHFFKITPSDLLVDPYRIYSRSIAVPLHGNADYRELGLKRFLLMLGAEEVKGKIRRKGESLFRKNLEV